MPSSAVIWIADCRWSGSQDEFDALALAVNNMVDRLAENTQLLRATFDSAAHDLRGPLYRLRGPPGGRRRMPTTDAPVRAGIDAALTELDRVQRTLATLLQIAQAESGMAAANRASVDLAELITDIGELYEPAAREKNMTLRVTAAGSCTVNGNRQLLAQAVANLVENSLKYITAGGHIEIRAQRDDQLVWLVVADDGPGIAPEDRAARAQTLRAAASGAIQGWQWIGPEPGGGDRAAASRAAAAGRQSAGPTGSAWVGCRPA